MPVDLSSDFGVKLWHGRGFSLASFLLPITRQKFMSKPVIYLYKVTFEETLDFYWGIHKEKKAGEHYLGSPVTHAWKWEFYTPKVNVCQVFDYTDEGWKEALEIEKRVIQATIDDPRCLNENVGGVVSLECSRKGGQKLNSIKGPDGKSLIPQMGGKKRALNLNSDKDELGRSKNALKGATVANAAKNEKGKSINPSKIHEEKTTDGKSAHAMRTIVKVHEEKTADGKSVHGLKRATHTNSLRVQCLETGYVSTPAGLTQYQRARGIDTSLRVTL